MFLAGRFKPALEIDGRWHGQAVVGQRPADFRQRPALRNMGIEIVMPQFDGLVAHFSGDLDFIQYRSGSDRAAIQRVDEVAHGEWPLG